MGFGAKTTWSHSRQAFAKRQFAPGRTADAGTQKIGPKANYGNATENFSPGPG
jgi:hypothetical protein